VRGIVLTGVTGGLVSSTAVTLSFARQSRERDGTGMAHILAAGMLLAWCIMFGRVIVEVLVVNRALVPRLAIPFAVMGAAAGITAWIASRRSAPARGDRAPRSGTLELRNPFSLTE